MQKEKVRVYVLARELNVDTKILLDLCKQSGYDVKNQLSSLEPEQKDAIEKLVKAGATKPAPAHAAPAKPVAPTTVPERIRNLDATRPARPAVKPTAPEIIPPAPVETALEPEPEPEPVVVPSVPEPEVEPVAAELTPVAPQAPRPAALPTIKSDRMPNLANRPAQVRPPAAPSVPYAPPATTTTTVVPPPVVVSPPTPVAPVAPTTPAAVDRPVAPPRPGPGMTPINPTRPVPNISGGPTRQPGESGARPGAGTPRPSMRRPPDLRPGLMMPKPPPTLRPSKLPEKKVETVAKPIARFTQEQMNSVRPIRPEDLLKPKVDPAAVPVIDESDDDDKKGKGGKAGAGTKAIPGRDDRRRERQQRAEKRKATTDVKVVAGKLLVTDDDRSGKSLHRLKDRMRHKQKPGIIKPIGPIIIETPTTVRALSQSLGVNSGELVFKLMSHGIAGVNINSMLEASTVELIAIDFGKDIQIKQPLDEEEQMLADLEVPDNPEDMIHRAPIVTIMGHVDHGKTSLLDKIRKSDVAATEAGGITQVIRAWRVDHGGRPVTFLDTPGHQAFTKMRARGANVTDIAVIVVAADDGVMPQTEEAIAHAKAAGVAIVVAINKTDMPSANVLKTRQQLYGLNVLPDDMGGDSPFVETSAATGKGIDELLDQLSVVAELKELKANPKKDGQGTCLEAMLSEGEGVRATLLVRDGTLRRGDVIVCGHSYGRVRQMYDDLGRPIEEAGPSVPVRITGLDEIPNADDNFLVLPDLALARVIAEKRKGKIAETSKSVRAPLTLERLGDVKIVELKVILKADFRGSVEAIKKELEKLVHAEVRVRVLHAGIGAITESDVQLALTSPEDTVLVGFNVVPDDRALALAEEKKVKIREYDIIYNLTNDIRAALEGKLKPREEVIHLGRALIRETFKISKTGTIAGCYVTQGTIKRNGKVRVIREGIVVYPPHDRTAGLESLKRFKEDVGEVREGFECGMRVAGYDDIKVGDVIEAFRVEHVQRTLD